MSENMDIFNLSPDAFVNPEKKKGGELYTPSADKGRDGVYKAVIRFVPFVHNPAKSRINKYYAWLTDPDTGDGFSVDSPRSVGKKCIINDAYWKLKKSPNLKEQEKAEGLNTVTSYYSLVQIVKDPNQPELEGKIMVFKFGTKINEKIENLLKPAIGDPVNPYDLFEGKLFALNITKKQKWNNYDSCEFVGDRRPIEIDGVPMKKTKEDMERIKQYLTDGSPDLSKYDYKDWTPEQEEKIHKVIRSLMPDVRLPERATEGAAAQVAARAEVSAASSNEEYEEPAQVEAPKAKPASKPAASIDDLYADL